MSEDRALVAFPVLLNRQVVVDNNSVLDTERVEVEAVDTSRVQVVSSVEEDLLHAAGLLGDSRDSSQEPAVSQASLIDVVGGDAVAEERLVREGLLGTNPLRHGIALQFPLTHVTPVKRGGVRGEVGVSVFVGREHELIEGSNRSLVTVLSCVTSVLR